MASKRTSLLLIILSVLNISSQTNGREYKAAAFEHQPHFVLEIKPPSREEALRIMRQNTAVYLEQAKAASKHGAQIIVFPEDGIYGFGKTRDIIEPYLEPIPEVSNATSIIPCLDPKPTTEILQELSCIARNNSIAVVANMGDIQYCTKSDPNCPSDGRYQYNTDVVFDHDGKLLAKYHKQHLFYEKAFNTPTKCEIVTFVTSFQVRFGVFTCFDMLFKDPAIDLVQTYGVQNIVFPTAWYHGFPMLISIEFQQAWSRTNCVNLIGANLYFPLFDFTGSGIYDCGEAKTYIYDDESAEKRLLFATLSGSRGPKKNENQMLDHERNLFRRDVEMLKETEVGLNGKMTDFQPNSQMFENPHIHDSPKTFLVNIMDNMFRSTKLTSPANKISVCQNGLCCYLDYMLPEGHHFTETFALGAFQGNNDDGFYWEVCLLFKCATNDVNSCGKVVKDSETLFQSLTLTGNFSASALVFPTTLASGITLFTTEEITFKDKSISGQALKKPLLTAALIGRDYSKDPHD